jgi:hypothetical protein
VSEQFNPGYPFEYEFLDDAYEETYRSEMVMGRLANAFAIVAILVSCLGLFGLSSFAAEQRRKEIGVRKVVDSSVPGLVVLLSKIEDIDAAIDEHERVYEMVMSPGYHASSSSRANRVLGRICSASK